MTTSVQPFRIAKTFAAPRALVFQVHTQAQHLQKWMSPQGFDVIHAVMDFKVGGSYHYGLQGPDNMQMWGKQVFREIVPNERLVFIQSFSDPEGNITRHPMSPTWPLEMLATLSFEDIDDLHTRVTTTWLPWNADEDGLATFDAARNGMQQGFTGTFTQLETYLKTL